MPSGLNHGKPVYKKDGAAAGNVSVLMYYWDERDGPTFSGWWFGPKVGGDQVWAYNGNKASPVPPPAGWKVPWDGPEDPVLRLTVAAASPAPQPGGFGAGGRPVPGPGGGQQPVQPPMRPQPVQPNPAAIAAEQEERRKREQERQRALLEQQRRREEEEKRRKQQEEEQRRRQKEREEEQARKAAEMQRKREEEETRRREQAAALAVRKVIQRVRIANPETYDSLRAELEAAQEKHLEAMGSQADKVTQEAQQTLEQTQKRIDDINRKREEEEQRKVEEERRRKEEVEKVENLMKAMTEEVKEVESKVAEVKAKAAALEAKDLAPEDTIKAVEEVQEASQAAQTVLDRIESSLRDKQEEMGDSDAAWKVKRDVTDMHSKVSSGRREIETLAASAGWAKEKAARKAAALQKEKERRDAFAKHDSDSDGKLSRSEVVAFSKAEFDFELGGEALDKIMQSLEPIAFEKFRPLFQKVAIVRSEVKARAVRAEREKRRQELEAKRQAVQKIAEEADALLTEADQCLSKAESEARPLALSGLGELAAEALKEAADSVETSVKEARALLEKAAEKAKKIAEDCGAEEELRGYENHFVGRLQQRQGRSESWAQKVADVADAARERAVRKAYAEIDSKRSDVVAAIRTKMGEDSKTGEQFFKGLTDSDKLSKEKFLEMLKGFEDLKFEDGQADRLFDHIAAGEAEVSQERFLELIRLYYKVVKGTVLSENLSIKSKTVRRLEMGEVLEALEGPAKEEGVGVQRVKCKAVNDDASGWVTIAGNQGTPFLEPGGNFLSCVKETVLTDGLSVQDSKTVRKIAKGEVIEVLEFTKKDASLDIKRIKGQAKLDGATGWITVSGNQGTAYLEPC